MMISRILLFTGCLLAQILHGQTLKSPDSFLGYKLGEKFTPHNRIVNYFEYAAASMPGKMKLEQYGATYENRPLLLACISDPSNMARIESIRENNLALAGAPANNASVKEPVIVWLSYNVHGNESSSSEVSMKVLYELLTSSSEDIKKWLKNTVVIIDPCLNPDGRERYVTWYNQVAGLHPNADPAATEHAEPWPEGRSNHYYFDLNRDWAWQTQIESRSRIAAYNKWLPEIHVDFHEQYPGSPYYFAPAAEPFHEVITPWQRSFQTTIGKNHARYFDANGWLYFTREYFDLFYPAYGDTYPIYNGSIGMTYEQAGHGIAGLAFKTGDDTLTLQQRIAHHFTTSMSTIEVASANAEKINTEFKKYFTDGTTNGIGQYKTYVISGASQSKLSALLDLFKLNKISWYTAGSQIKTKGYNYFTGKEESYTTASNDIIVSAYQPKSSLVQVLFEPKSKLSDSSTYDITAWALPYAYGIQAYAVKEKIGEGIKVDEVTASVKLIPDAYGYLINYASFRDGKILASLLKKGIKVRYAEKDFSFAGKKYDRGTLVVLRAGNESKLDDFRSVVNQLEGEVTPVISGFMDSGFDFGSDKLHLIKKPRIAVLTGSSASSLAVGEVWHLFEQQLDYPITLIAVNESGQMDFKNYDLLIIPSGEYKFLNDKEGNSALKNWVNDGGRVIALENAASQLLSGDWGFKMKKEDTSEEKNDYSLLKKFGSRDRDGIVNNIPGAIYKVELDNTHPLAFGYPDYYFSLKRSSDLFEFLKIGWNVGVIKKENQVSGFVGSKAIGKMQDGAVIAVQPVGKGNLICFADDPLFRSFWENGKLLFTNAIFLTEQY